ncbi:ALI_collapsed_G0005760.mRNA.1.CDS.1 [Saccharomyces cerevisiae]|nr:ALI_collapsed_G0005760.mRNA.1.CDS.1 [Saccharomyces cerevisiae]
MFYLEFQQILNSSGDAVLEPSGPARYQHPMESHLVPLLYWLTQQMNSYNPVVKDNSVVGAGQIRQTGFNGTLDHLRNWKY